MSGHAEATGSSHTGLNQAQARNLAGKRLGWRTGS